MEKRRATHHLVQLTLVALLSSVISLTVSLVVWKAVQPKAGIREDVKLLPGLEIPPRKSRHLTKNTMCLC
jgi:Na+/H+-dicarboxylate symporter